MATKKVKIITATVCVCLLIFIFLMRLALGNSNGFFIVAGVDLTTMLAIFVWLLVRCLTDRGMSIDARKANIIAASSVIVLITTVVLLWVRGIGLRKTFFLVAIADAVIILVVCSWEVIQLAMAYRKKRMERNLVSEGDEVRLEYNLLRRVAGLPIEFRFEEIEAATDNFQTLVGKGASGSVFKGILKDGTLIAVKRIEGQVRGGREFRSEVAAMASVQHVNLVHLLGYFLVPGGQRYLVYEYIHNGSLDAWIFPKGEDKEARCLTWGLRYQVAIDVAKALAYLHHECRSRILHLDIKPENILLDESFRAHVSDFGLSTLMAKDESSIFTTLRGTRGYFAPEWFLEQGISEKSDVYSYGMVLLELVGGRRTVSVNGNGNDAMRKWSYFPRIVSEKVREGKLMEVVDERLVMGGGIEEREVRVLVHVALWCIQDKPELRPSMARVVGMLQGQVSVDTPPETPMFMINLLSSDYESTDCSIKDQTSTSAAESCTALSSSTVRPSSVPSMSLRPSDIRQ